MPIHGLWFILRQIYEDNVGTRTDTILNTVMKFKVSRSCSDEEEASANFGRKSGITQRKKEAKKEKSIRSDNRMSALHNES